MLNLNKVYDAFIFSWLHRLIDPFLLDDPKLEFDDYVKPGAPGVPERMRELTLRMRDIYYKEDRMPTDAEVKTWHD